MSNKENSHFAYAFPSLQVQQALPRTGWVDVSGCEMMEAERQANGDMLAKRVELRRTLGGQTPLHAAGHTRVAGACTRASLIRRISNCRTRNRNKNLIGMQVTNCKGKISSKKKK
jgi:hypothetical protein